MTQKFNYVAGNIGTIITALNNAAEEGEVTVHMMESDNDRYGRCAYSVRPAAKPATPAKPASAPAVKPVAKSAPAKK